MPQASPKPPPLLPVVRSIELTRPLAWLALAWRDMERCGWVSYLHGLVLGLFGAVLLWMAHDRFWLLAGAFSGFLVVSPVLATGLYALSRALSRGEPPTWRVVLRTWSSPFSLYQHTDWRLVRFGLLLAMAGTGWVLTSAALITLMSPHPVQNPADFVRHVMLGKDHFVFELWLAMGGIMAAPMFASSVVAMPLLLDRKVSVMQAVLTSWQTVIVNPAPLALWAGLIMAFTLLGLGSMLLGLLAVIPMLGHASWYAYLDLVDASAFEEIR